MKERIIKNLKKVLNEEVRELKDVPKGAFFKIVNSKGNVSTKVYIKGEYDRTEKKYLCDDTLDVLGYGKYVKRKQKVLVGFTY